MKRTPLVRKTPLRKHGDFFARSAALKRRAPLRPVSQRDSKRLERKLGQLCRVLVVILRDRNTCQRCGAPAERSKIDWAHVKNRGAKSILFVPWNSLALCVGCHFWFDANKGNAMHAGVGMQWWRDKFPFRAHQLAAWERSGHHAVPDRMAEKEWLEVQIALAERSLATSSPKGGADERTD